MYVIYSFFFVRKIIAHMVTFFFYCLVIPLTILIPEVHVPIWGAVYIPSVITILNSVGTPRYFLPLFLTWFCHRCCSLQNLFLKVVCNFGRSIHLLFYWILFENVMSLHRTKATFIGLLEYGRANEWVVTEKLGDSVNSNNKNKPGDAAKKNAATKAPKKTTRSKFVERSVSDFYFYLFASSDEPTCTRRCASVFTGFVKIIIKYLKKIIFPSNSLLLL